MCDNIHTHKQGFQLDAVPTEDKLMWDRKLTHLPAEDHLFFVPSPPENKSKNTVDTETHLLNYGQERTISAGSVGCKSTGMPNSLLAFMIIFYKQGGLMHIDAPTTPHTILRHTSVFYFLKCQEVVFRIKCDFTVNKRGSPGRKPERPWETQTGITSFTP